VTLAISLKVNDGLVLAADSASTLFNDAGNIIKVYNNANKVFNLRKGFPIGAITWAGGSIGPAAISTLTKDLRRRFSGEDPGHKDWELDKETYTIEQVAVRLREFMYEELYVPLYQDQAVKPSTGFLVVGHSANEGMAEEYEVIIDNSGNCAPPVLTRPKEACGWNARGQPEAVSRFLLGVSQRLPQILVEDLGVQPDQVAQAMQLIQAKSEAQMVANAMPIQDAIDLAEFLVDMTIKYERFLLMPGSGTVGGPIEVAAITKHEGFKWVKRKHYYNGEFNPGG
jgi:hypothetical protein